MESFIRCLRRSISSLKGCKHFFKMIRISRVFFSNILLVLGNEMPFLLVPTCALFLLMSKSRVEIYQRFFLQILKNSVPILTRLTKEIASL